LKFKLEKKDIAILLAILAICALAILCLLFIDKPLFDILKQAPLKRHGSDWQFGFKQLGKTWLLVWLILLWVWINNSPKLAMTAFLAMLILIPLVLPLKTIIHRPRPKDVIKAPARAGLDDFKLRSSSFPSGDAANAFAVAAVLAFFAKPIFKPALFLAAALIAIFRVTSLSHYPSDACAGTAIGLFAAWLAIKIANNSHAIANLKTYNRKWRIITGLSVFAMIPLVSAFERANPITIFLKTYYPLLIAMIIFFKHRDIFIWIRSKKISKT